MVKALIVILIVLGLLTGLLLTLRRTANMGTPSREVLERARRRARELDAREKAGDDQV
jgi:uncharacterized membrane protein affecting hemolysin expression